MRNALFGALLTVLVVIPATSQAVPAWGRKYKMQCGSCHFGGSNKLTLTGQRFQRRGYVMAADDPIKEPGEINLANYLSIASKVRFEAEKDADPSTKFDVEALSIYSGGPIYDKFSYFFEIYLHERGKDASSSGGQIDTATRSKLAEAYAQYTSNPAGDDYYFVRAGSYTPRLIYSASTGGRLSVNRPLVWNDTLSKYNLYTPRDRFYGIAGGVSTSKGLFAEAGITNGGGGNSRPNQAENNGMKDIWASVGYTFEDVGASVGLYGYKGYYPVTSPSAYEQEFTRFALMGDFTKDKLTASAAYTSGNNKLLGADDQNAKGYYLEVGYNFTDDDTFFGRYDSYDYDISPKKTGFTLGYSKRLGALGRFVIEGSEFKVDGSDKQQKITFELNWLF